MYFDTVVDPEIKIQNLVQVPAKPVLFYRRHNAQ
jgi:hypothetical protein